MTSRSGRGIDSRIRGNAVRVSIPTDSSGSFRRHGPRFTDRVVADPQDSHQWPAEPGRYRLVVSLACPWAHRSVIVRRLMGLEDAISLAITDPIQDERSWRFTLDDDGVDPVLGIRYLEEAYLARDPENGLSNGVSVPAIVEESTGLLVTNDFPMITLDLGIEWAKYQREGAPTLYPEDQRAEIDELNEGVFHDVNNGVYKAGFASSQNAYETAYAALFARLDELDERLENRRYLLGDVLRCAHTSRLPPLTCVIFGVMTPNITHMASGGSGRNGAASGSGGVPSPKGEPPISSRWWGSSHADGSGPSGTTCVGLIPVCTW